MEKQCPQCGGAIDYFGSCRKCGREWSEKLEEGEQPVELPQGQQYPSTTPVKPKKTTRTRFTKNKASSDKFALWQIDVANDTETEIIRKRSLMHMDSNRMYNTLGFSLQAQRSQKEAVMWLSRLWEILPEEEQKKLTPTLSVLKKGFADIAVLAEQKITETADMEKALEEAHKNARTARTLVKPGQDSEGYGVPTPVSIAPEDLQVNDLLDLAKTRLANFDKGNS